MRLIILITHVNSMRVECLAASHVACDLLRVNQELRAHHELMSVYLTHCYGFRAICSPLQLLHFLDEVISTSVAEILDRR